MGSGGEAKTEALPVLRADLSSQAFKRDPFPTLARMRELGPVIRARLSLFGRVWLATTYDAVHELLHDHHRFGTSPAAAGNRGMAALLRWLPRTLQPLTTNSLATVSPQMVCPVPLQDSQLFPSAEGAGVLPGVDQRFAP